MSDQRLRLQQYLDSVPFGAITDTDTLIPLLKNAWQEFDGSDRCGMKNDKLTRIENARWDPPCLEFTIERHGGTVLGSSRGELQHWMINIIGSSQRSVQFWSVSMANKPSIVSDLHGWRTPSVSGAELQAPGKSGPQ